jgi:opacity protein-like surface antigen
MFRILFASLFLLLSFQAQSQISFGLKGGLSTQINKPTKIDLGVDSIFSFGVDKVKAGTQFGAYLRLGGKIYLQPELMFSSNKTDYKVGNMDSIFSARYQNLTSPLLAGFTTGPLRFHGGPVGHVFINNKTDLKKVEENFNNLAWGWLAGVTIGKGRISADLRYEGNFGNRTDFTFAGKQYDFTSNPNRFVVNLNIKLL